MTRAKRRLHPLHQKTTWSMRNAIRSEPHGSDTFPRPGCDASRALRHIARFRDASNIIEYVREASWLEVHYLWWAWQSLGEPGHSAITNRADIAQFLGENYIGTQLTKKRLIDCINRPVIMQRAAHPLVDFATRQASIVRWTMRDPWPRICFLRKIAFMRNTHYLLHQSECGGNLRCSGQKRNDADHFLLYAVSRHENEKRARTKEKERDEEFQISRIVGVPYKTPTAREISSTTMVKEIKIWTIARIFAQRASNGASVGPKVELCVKATKR